MSVTKWIFITLPSDERARAHADTCAHRLTHTHAHIHTVLIAASYRSLSLYTLVTVIIRVCLGHKGIFIDGLKSSGQRN